MEVASYPRCWKRRAAVRRISCRESTTVSRAIACHGKQLRAGKPTDPAALQWGDEPEFSLDTHWAGQVGFLKYRPTGRYCSLGFLSVRCGARILPREARASFL